MPPVPAFPPAARSAWAVLSERVELLRSTVPDATKRPPPAALPPSPPATPPLVRRCHRWGEAYVRSVADLTRRVPSLPAAALGLVAADRGGRDGRVLRTRVDAAAATAELPETVVPVNVAVPAL